MRLVTLLLLAFTIVSGNAYGDILVGRVIAVVDDDTLTLLDRDNRQHKIRLAGIDAPEGGQSFGHRSKENLSQLVFDRNVRARVTSVIVTGAWYARCSTGRVMRAWSRSARGMRGGTESTLKSKR